MLLSLSLISGCAKKPDAVQDSTQEAPAQVNLGLAADMNVKLGMMYLQKGETQRAQQRFTQALANAPENPAAWYSMGYFWEVMGDNAKAEPYFKKAISIDPQNGNAKNNYGTFLCHAGRYKEGIYQFKAAINTPNYLNQTGAYENIGLCSMKIPDYKMAKEYLTRAVSQNPNLTESLEGLAEISYKEKSYTAACNYLKRYKILAAKPSNAMVKLETNLSKGKKCSKTG